MSSKLTPFASMSPEAIIRHWVKSARDNWKTTRYLFEKHDYVSALFFAHLYLEKLLKAHVV